MTVDGNGGIANFNATNTTKVFNFKAKTKGQTNDDVTKCVEIIVVLKYLSNYWRTLKMSLINFEINFILTWSAICVTVYTTVANQGGTFAIIDTRLYVPILCLSTQDNTKLVQQLKSGFKRTN